VAIGRFESAAFDGRAWKPRVPVAALRHAQPEDLFWAARRVAAFSDAMIRALVHAGGYSDQRDEQHLADTLIARRDKIAATYLTSVNPLVNFVLSRDDRLSFVNAASIAGVGSPPSGYHVSWAAFDNATGTATPIGDSTTASGDRIVAPAALPHTPGAFVRVRVTPQDPAGAPQAIDAYFRYASDGWTVVGLNRRATTS
jgi:hypothetical protein